MNCCNDFGQCQQGTGCPARTNPAKCLTAGFCQSTNECHCEKTVNEGSQPWARFDCFAREVVAFILGMLFVLALLVACTFL
jgi:hypothetical protein